MAEQTTLPPREAVDFTLRLCRSIIDDQLLSRKPLTLTLGAMLTARQVYAMGAEDLSFQLDDIDDRAWSSWIKKALDGNPPPEGCDLDLSPAAVRGAVQDYFVQAMLMQAAEFDPGEALDNVHSALLGWVGEAAVRIKRRWQELAAAERERASLARQAQPVILPWAIDATDRGNLDRGGAVLVLVGWRPAVMWLLDNLCEKLVEHTETAVLRLTVFAPAPERAQSSQVVEFVDWAKCLRTSASLNEYLVGKSEEAKDGHGRWTEEKPDLLIIDDILQAGPQALTLQQGQTVSLSTVNQSLKRMRAWARDIGAGAVAGLPMVERMPPDLSSPLLASKWADVLSHNLVRRVYVSEEDGEFVLTLESSRVVFRVPKSALLPAVIEERV